MTETIEPRFEIRVDQGVAVPAPLAYRWWVERTFIHPDQLKKKQMNRLVRFVWKGEAGTESQVEIRFIPQGKEACLLQVIHSAIATPEEAALLETRWTEELETFTAYAEERNEIPALELQVGPKPIKPTLN